MVTATTSAWDKRHQILNQYLTSPTMTFAEFCSEIYTIFCERLQELGQITADTFEAELEHAFAKRSNRTSNSLHQIARGEVTLPPDAIMELARSWSFSEIQAEQLAESSHSNPHKMPIQYEHSHTPKTYEGRLPRFLADESTSVQSALAAEEYRSENPRATSSALPSAPQRTTGNEHLQRLESKENTITDDPISKLASKSEQSQPVSTPRQHQSLELETSRLAQYPTWHLPVDHLDKTQTISGQMAHYRRAQVVRGCLLGLLKGYSLDDQAVDQLNSLAGLPVGTIAEVLNRGQQRSRIIYKVLIAMGQGDWISAEERSLLQRQLQHIEDQTSKPRTVTPQLSFEEDADLETPLQLSNQQAYALRIGIIRVALGQAIYRGDQSKREQNITNFACLVNLDPLQVKRFMARKLRSKTVTEAIQHALLDFGWLTRQQNENLREQLQRIDNSRHQPATEA